MEQQLEFDWGDDLTFGDPQSQESALIANGLEFECLDDAAPAHSVPVDKQPQRIKHLERALEQCQLYIDALKSQLADQDFLEMQLATTEEFTHIQKQAIVALQHQLENREQKDSEQAVLEQQKSILETQLLETETQLHNQHSEVSALQEQVEQAREALNQFKQKTEQLSSQVQVSQDSVVQETQQRIIAQQTVERLRADLRDREAKLSDLEATLQRTEDDRQKIADDLSNHRDIVSALQESDQSQSPKNQVIQRLSRNLLQAQDKISTLEKQVSNQSVLQAQLQHSTQEFESKAQDSQERSNQLEQQVTEMQEEILRQVQQAHEYETAIQHWKDRCIKAEQAVVQMKQILEQVVFDRRASNASVSKELANTITEITTPTPPAIAPLSVPDSSGRKNLMDLPALVHRWRNERS